MRKPHVLFVLSLFVASAADDCNGITDTNCASGEKDVSSILQSSVRVGKHRTKRLVQELRDDGVWEKLDFEEKETAAATLVHGVSASLQATKSDSPVNVRPGLAKNETDVVEFGILLKKWYGIFEKSGETSADAVIALHWSDPRAVKLIPGKATQVRMSVAEAAKKMWLPDIKVTNVAHGGTDMISESLLIHGNGRVTQVNRVLLTVKQTIETTNFPFDVQTVQIKIASGTYMRDELKLTPIKTRTEWGVQNHGEIFNNSVWKFVKDDIKVQDDINGELSKSRGVLTIDVKRCLAEFVSSVFMPSVVFLFMTWSAFWLPLGGAYAMPRIALNAFALLCQVSVSQLADRKIPETGGRAWMTEYLGLCVQLQFVLALLNVLIITIEDKRDGHVLAGHLNDQMILSYPVTASLNILVLVLGYNMASRVCLGITLLGYLAYLSLSYKWHHEKKVMDRQNDASTTGEKQEGSHADDDSSTDGEISEEKPEPEVIPRQGRRDTMLVWR